MLSSGTEWNASAVVQGIEKDFIPALLHRIHVQSGLPTGFFSVSVCSSFPIDGIDFIMGNDIAGGKAYPVLEVFAEPIPESELDDLAMKHPGIFQVSVLTRARAREQAQEIDLTDSLFVPTPSQDKAPPSGDSADRSPSKFEPVKPLLLLPFCHCTVGL